MVYESRRSCLGDQMICMQEATSFDLYSVARLEIPTLPRPR
jgi:hypothetical protein